MDTLESELSSSSSDSENEDLGSLELTTLPSSAEIVEFLECPVCYDIPLPPIRTCTQGHILCGNCANKVLRCPLCLQSIGNGRNYFAEEFIRKSTFECKFKVEGCREGVSGERVKEHFLKCQFRPIKCSRCSDRIEYTKFKSHLMNSHKISQWDINDDGQRVMDLELEVKLVKRRNSLNQPHQQQRRRFSTASHSGSSNNTSRQLFRNNLLWFFGIVGLAIGVQMIEGAGAL